MNLTEFYEQEKERFLTDCTSCGLCVETCPILSHTELKQAAPDEVMEAIKDYLDTGKQSPTIPARTFSCMECFKCTAGVCPESLNPLLVQELVKHRHLRENGGKRAYGSSKETESSHRVLAASQLLPGEYSRISTPSPVKKSKYLFFPGCNVYYQPEKILNALDLIDMVTDECAFVPGLDHCCGDGDLFLGDIEEGARRAGDLMETLRAYAPDTVILWCPTCQCRFDTFLSSALEMDFKVQSLPQFLAENVSSLPLQKKDARHVTLHEPCKSAYTGVDLTGVRQLLTNLPGVTLTEMPRHGKETACCGSGAAVFYPESFAAVRDERLQEAAATGADTLVDVCHYCHQCFASQADRYDFTMVSYVTLLAEAVGIHRPDKFARYMAWGDLERITADAAPCIDSAPFSRETIRQVLKHTFVDITG